MKSKNVIFKTVYILTAILILLVYLLGYTYSQFAPMHVLANDSDISGNAEESQVEKLEFENDEELKKFSLLGGTNSQRALAEYPGLGLSKEFSIFAEGDVTLTGADTEGKIAVGGTLNAVAEDKSQSTDEVAEGEDAGDESEKKYYKYQVGIKNEDENAADIIVGQGLNGEVALDFGYSADGETQVEDSKLVAYSSKATGMNLEKYTEEERKHFVQADLIDFDAEFSRLREYSEELAGKEATGQMLDGLYGTVGNVGIDLLEVMTGKTESDDIKREWKNRRRESVHQSKVLKGDNEDINIFTVDAKTIRSFNVIFDVPYNSKVVLNLTGENVELDFGIDHNIYYPLTEEKLAEIDVNEQRIGYVKKNLNNKEMAEYITDEDDTIRPFIRIAGGDANEGKLEDLSDKILINITEADKMTIYDCGVSVLAPNTDVSTPMSDNENSPSHYAGYFLGTLICKSYEGNLQFGSAEKNLNRKYRLNLSKVDQTYGNHVPGAGLELYDSEGTLIHSWTSTENAESVELDVGTYTIKETSVPENYESNTQDLTFTVDVYGDVVSNGEKIAKADVIFTKDYEEKSYEDHSADWDTDDYVFNCSISYESYVADDVVSGYESNHGVDTNDGGQFEIRNSNENLQIPADETADNVEITYEMKNKLTHIAGEDANEKAERYLNSLVKYNESHKIEWVVNMESFANMEIRDLLESDDRYIIIIKYNMARIYVDGSQTYNGSDVILSDGVNYTYAFISVSKKGKFEGGNIITISELTGNKMGNTIIKDNSAYIATSYKDYGGEHNNVAKFDFSAEEIKFPTNWDILYNNLDDSVGNITKVSFDVNTDNAEESTDKELYMLVAENNGQGYGENWIEYIKYKNVADGDNIITKVPYVPEMYAYYNEFDDPANIKFTPHFYRQDMSSEEPAKEVSDIDVENVKVYWKSVKYTTKSKVIETSLKNNDMSEIKIPNKHIVTTVKITKLDADTKVALKNAIFGVYSKSDNKLLYKSEETDDNGVVVLNEIPLDKGSYYVKEITAPDGYQLSDEVKEFNVEQTDLVEYTFEDKVLQDDIKDNTPNSVGTSSDTSGSGSTGGKNSDSGATSDDNKKEQVTQELIRNSITTGDTIFVALILLRLSVVVVTIVLVAKNVNKKN